MFLGGGRCAALVLLALAAFIGYCQTASLNSQPIPTKDKKSPEVIYYERAADKSRVDKRLDKAVPAEPAAWPSFRDGSSDSRVVGGKSRQPYGSPVATAPTSGSKGRGGGSNTAAAADNDEVAGFVDKSLLAEALMQMLIDELGEGGVGAHRGDGSDVADAPETEASEDFGYGRYESGGDSVVDDSAAEDAEEAEYENPSAAIQGSSAAERASNTNGAIEHGDDFATAAATHRGQSSYRQAADLAAAGATPRRGQLPSSTDLRKAAQSLQTTAAAITTEAMAADPDAGDGNDGDQNVIDGSDASVVEDDKDDSREDKRVRVEVSGGVQPRPPQSSATGAMASGAGYSGKVEPTKSDKDGDDPEADPYREYLDMWYKANIAEDYEEESLARLRNYLEYMKLSKNRSGSEKKPRGGGSSAAAAAITTGSSATARNGKAMSTSSTSAGRKKRSLPDDGSLLLYDAPQQAVGVLPADGVYLSSGEAARLRQFIIDLNEQNNKYEAVLRSVLAADDDDSTREVEERARFASAVDRNMLSAAGEERNKNLYRLAYGLADPYRRRIGY